MTAHRASWLFRLRRLDSSGESARMSGGDYSPNHSQGHAATRPIMGVMYRCAHCRDLHIAADQARGCSEHDDHWYEDALAEVERILERGPIAWEVKRVMRDDLQWTWPERRLWSALREVLPPDSLRSQWWIPGCDYRVDLLVVPLGLVIEVDGASHEGRAGADRIRSSAIRSQGYDILRVTNDDIGEDADRIAFLVSERMFSELGLTPKSYQPAADSEPQQVAFEVTA